MKNNYDKILFLVAVLAACVSGYFYINAQKGAESAKAQQARALALTPGGEDWAQIEVPKVNPDASSTWEAVKAQDEDGMWLFQLFTSPKIWVDADGEFIVEPPLKKEVIKKYFGYKYGSLKNDEYPIRPKGYTVSADGKIVQLWDESKNLLMQGKINEEISVRKSGSVTGEKVGSGITVKSHEIINKTEPTGLISKITKVVLFDSNIGKEVVIFSDKPTYLEEARAIVLSPDRSNNPPWEIKKAGDKLETEDAVFTVKKLDFEKEEVEVEKVSKDKGGKTQLMRLSKSGGNELLNK